MKPSKGCRVVGRIAGDFARAMARPVIEQLENRRLLSGEGPLNLVLMGTDGDDEIVVSRSPLVTSGSAGLDGIIVYGAAGVPDATVFDNVVSIEIHGGKGNDHIRADLSAWPGYLLTSLTVWGEEGDDTLEFAGSGAVAHGGAGNDIIKGECTASYSEAPAGVSVRYDQRQTASEAPVPNDGFGGHDTLIDVCGIEGSQFDDVIYGSESVGNLIGLDGNDQLIRQTDFGLFAGRLLKGTIDGGNGNDYLEDSAYGGGGTLSGGKGDDTLRGLSQSDHLLGGPGNDSYEGCLDLERPSWAAVLEFPQASITHAVNVRLDLGLVLDDGTGGVDTVLNVQNVWTDSPYNDTIYGDARDNIINSGTGKDVLVGGGGYDEINGKAIPPNRRPFDASTGVLSIFGGDDDDVIVIKAGVRPGSVIVSGAPGIVDGTKFSGVTKLMVDGGAGNDSIRFDPEVQLLNAHGANPASLDGGDGNDTLVGGNVCFRSSRGNDSYEGIGDKTHLLFETPDHRVIVRLDQGLVPDDGYGGRDRVVNVRDVYLALNYIGNIVYGDDQDNVIVGGAGRDLIVGNGGNDRITLWASGTDNTVLGGDGNDRIEDMYGHNVIDGGPGNDKILAYYESSMTDTIVGDAGDVIYDMRYWTDSEPPAAATAGPSARKRVAKHPYKVPPPDKTSYVRKALVQKGSKWIFVRKAVVKTSILPMPKNAPHHK